MASFAAARSTLRSSSIRNAASKFASATSAKPKPSASTFRLPAAPRILRSPVELSSCVESLLPMHSVTASALMTSMLSVTRGGYGWLSDEMNYEACSACVASCRACKNLHRHFKDFQCRTPDCGVEGAQIYSF